LSAWFIHARLEVHFGFRGGRLRAIMGVSRRSAGLNEFNMALRLTVVYCVLQFLISWVDAFNAVAELTRQAYPQVIGHAGASGYVPESSLIGYDLAANLLADYSEPDLVLTKDNYFIASHDLTLEGTTNVGDLFPASRMSTFVIEGVAITGYYAINFTLR
jgi:hypothetical protein